MGKWDNSDWNMILIDFYQLPRSKCLKNAETCCMMLHFLLGKFCNIHSPLPYIKLQQHQFKCNPGSYYENGCEILQYTLIRVTVGLYR